MAISYNDQKNDWLNLNNLVVFDGVCNFCNASVNFLMKHDPEGRFKFGTLQSEPAQKILNDLKLNKDDFETFLFIDEGQVFTKSTAALHIAKQMSKPWPLLGLFLWVPRPIRDGIYDFFARHRYRWMGKRQTCRFPTPAEQERFVS